MIAYARQPTFITPASDPCPLAFGSILHPSFAGGITFHSIGPRIGFGKEIPLMGKEQKYYFPLYDGAAVIKLPRSWPPGERMWSLDTRMTTSARLLTGANESGL